MKRSRGELGFTIVEITLFIAISSMMIIAAMITVRGRTAAVQYTDASRSVEAFLDRRVSQVLQGSITAETEPCRWNGASYVGGASDGTCIFLGYMFRTEAARPTEIDVIQVYGNRIPSNDPCLSVAANVGNPLVCANPQPTPVTSAALVAVETFQIPWGMEVTQTQSNGNNTRLWGYLRDPVGQVLIPVAFHQGSEGEVDLANAYRESHMTTDINDEFSVSMCLIDSRGKKARLLTGTTENQFTLELEFDVTAACPDAVVP